MLDPDFPARRVTWDDVRDHMVGKLMIDPEWLIDGTEELTWWPTPLAQHISVTAAGEFETEGTHDENSLRVTATTTICSIDEQRGVQMAYDYGHWIPTGALIWDEGGLRVTCSLALNPRCRELLEWFHQAALIQAAVALRLAREWAEVDGLEYAISAHPSTGVREDCDELIHIYLGDRLGLDQVADLRDCYEAARPLLREQLLGLGYTAGHSGEDVDFFNGDDDGFDIGIGFMPGDWQTEQFGLGLVIRARVLRYGQSFTEGETNNANVDIALGTANSQFGRITGGDEAERSGSLLEAYVPHATLAAWRMNPQQMATAISNATVHVAAAAQVFRHHILGIPWPEEGRAEAG